MEGGGSAESSESEDEGPAPAPAPAGCPVLAALAKDSSECPDELDLVNCEDPGLEAGDFCEGDGECGTDKTVDNCSNDIHQGADIYRVVSASGDGPAPEPEPVPAPAPRPAPQPQTGSGGAGCPSLEGLAKNSPDCPEELDLVDCDDPSLKVGDLCEGDGECGTDKYIDNCKNEIHKGADIYRVLELGGGVVTAPAPAPAPQPGGCPVLEGLPKDSPDCPEELDLVDCNDVNLKVGDFCESDGECGTDKFIDNCRNEIHKGADIYRVLALAGSDATSTTAADEPASTTAAEVMLGHKASKCIDQCSSKDYQGVKACEKHYQIEGPNGCDTAKYAANIDGYYSGYNEKCHACKYDQTWGLCSEKSSCDDSDAIQEDSNGVCCCGGTDEFGVKESCMYYNDEWRFR